MNALRKKRANYSVETAAASPEPKPSPPVERIETIMSRKNTTKDPHAKTHMAIALAIRNAKREMFKRHRAGMPLHVALDTFLSELTEMREQTVYKAHCDKEAAKESPAEKPVYKYGGYNPLSEDEIDYICESLGGGSNGAVQTAQIILLLRHVFGLTWARENGEGALTEISERLLTEDCFAREFAVTKLLEHSREYINENLSGGKDRDA